MSTTILIADDHQILRQGLKLLLEKQDYIVVGEFSQGKQAIDLCLELKPDIVIMDINMSNTDGINITKKISSRLPGTKIIALSGQNEKRFITDILKAGASGYVLKEKAFTELVKAIKAVQKNQIYLCPMSSNLVLEDYLKTQYFVNTDGQKLLNEFEIELIKLFSDGISSKQIADNFKLSTKTIDANRRKIMKKLNIDNIPDLVKFSIKEGFTSLD